MSDLGGKWRIIVRWCEACGDARGEIDDTHNVPHLVLIELLRNNVQLKIRGMRALMGRPPLVDLAERTIVYNVELWPE